MVVAICGQGLWAQEKRGSGHSTPYSELYLHSGSNSTGSVIWPNQEGFLLPPT